MRQVPCSFAVKLQLTFGSGIVICSARLLFIVVVIKSLVVTIDVIVATGFHILSRNKKQIVFFLHPEDLLVSI